MMYVVKLDRRNTGFYHWKYYVEVKTIYATERRITFFNWREWCWNNWGASKELHEYDGTDYFDDVNSSNPRWCWLNKDYTKRIYIQNDERLELFTLRWS